MKIAAPTPQQRMTAPLNRSAEQRGIRHPIPFGWYVMAYSDELAAGEVKALRYFGRDLVLFRTESGVAQVLDAYAKQNVRAQPTASLDEAKTWLRGEIASWEKITKEIKIDLTD